MILLAVGFILAITPTMLSGVWNGQSLLGTLIVAYAGYRLIATKPYQKCDIEEGENI
jgi:hypothetical protein